MIIDYDNFDDDNYDGKIEDDNWQWWFMTMMMMMDNLRWQFTMTIFDDDDDNGQLTMTIDNENFFKHFICHVWCSFR